MYFMAKKKIKKNVQKIWGPKLHYFLALLQKIAEPHPQQKMCPPHWEMHPSNILRLLFQNIQSKSPYPSHWHMGTYYLYWWRGESDGKMSPVYSRECGCSLFLHAPSNLMLSLICFSFSQKEPPVFPFLSEKLWVPLWGEDLLGRNV